jgi:GH24 family phage-related lysozyme (muramidase)
MINNNGLQLEEHYESLNDGDLTLIGLQPKMDCCGIWTEGWGHAMVDS